MKRVIKEIYGYSNIDNLIPGIRGQRAFPTKEFRGTDPFLMLDHIGPQKVGKSYFLNGANHAHPHRGFETVTFMFEGRMEHVDSLGNKETLHSGSVQRMNAGKGIIHGGDMASDQKTERFHEVQLWVNNPASQKMSEPEIQNVQAADIPTIVEQNTQLRVISGKLNGVEGAIQTISSTQIGHFIATETGKMIIDGIEKGHRLMVYVLEGNVQVNSREVKEFQLVTFSDEGDEIEVKANESAQLLVMAGAPINEPVVFGGPFVMNSQEEIQQAHQDFQNGLFGIIH